MTPAPSSVAKKGQSNQIRGRGDGITKGQSSRVQCMEDTEVSLEGTVVSSGISNTFMLQKVI